MKKIVLIFSLFFLDRITKIYLITLQTGGTIEFNFIGRKIISLTLNQTDIDFYILPFLNFYLVWNTGIGFGLISLETNIFYHILTLIIAAVNIVLIFFIIKSKGIYVYLLALIIGGSLGNLFDRIYYYAVPDFIDFHVGNFHWFVFNVADIFITVGIIGLMLKELLKKEKISQDV